jgi:hypothetical protein
MGFFGNVLINLAILIVRRRGAVAPPESPAYALTGSGEVVSRTARAQFDCALRTTLQETDPSLPQEQSQASFSLWALVNPTGALVESLANSVSSRM